MMMVYFSSIVSPEGATYATAMLTVDGMKVLKNGYRMVTLNDPIGAALSKYYKKEME